MKKSILITLSLLAGNILYGQNFQPLDTYIEKLAKNQKFMGTVVMTKDDEIVYSKGVGNTNFKRHQVPTDRMMYKIGSISKTFTATLVMKAVEEGKISLDQTIEKYFPSIKNASVITIKNLLQHRSGIHNYTSLDSYFDFNTQEMTDQQMISKINSGGSDFKPGSKFSYSNSNYFLLARILEKNYDKSFGELLDAKITKPLGLSDIRIADKIDSDNESHSYQYKGTWKKEEETHHSVLKGAGDIIASAIDLAKFGNALFNGEIVSQKSLEEMKSLNEGYGYGLISVPFNDKKGYGHNGGVDGFHSVMYHFPDGDVTYVMVSNGLNYDSNQIAINSLISAYNSGQLQPANIVKTISVSEDTLEQYIGVYKSSAFPLDITVSKEGNTLLAQATGQPQFALDAVSDDKFIKTIIKLELIFDAEKNTMKLIQYGNEFDFVKK